MSPPSRVGVVTTSYPREAGDPAGGFVAGFTRWLAGAGAAVEVIAAGPGGDRVDGIPVERVDGRGLFYGGGGPDALASGGARAWARAARFSTELAARALVRARHWDAAVSHWVVPSGMAAAAALAAGRRGRPHLAIAHSSDVALLRRSKRGRAALAALARRAHLVYSAPHLVVDGAPGRVMAMGIDAAEVSGGDRERGRRRFLLHRSTALFLGRLVPVKGLDLLLASLPPGVELVVAGAGPMEAEWRGLAARLGACARFVGEVRGVERADLLAAADLLVLPSRPLADGRGEGTPTVLFEALAAGLPVVATRTAAGAALEGGLLADATDLDCGAEALPFGHRALLPGTSRLGEALAPGAGGLWVEERPDALRAAIATVAGNPALRARLASAARPAGAARDWSRVGPRLAAPLFGPG